MRSCARDRHPTTMVSSVFSVTSHSQSSGLNQGGAFAAWTLNSTLPIATAVTSLETRVIAGPSRSPSATSSRVSDIMCAGQS